LEDRENKDEYFYIDLLESVSAGGTVELKLWDMGTSIPVASTTSIDDGTQYEKLGDAGITGIQVASLELTLDPGIKQYHFDKFVAGAALEIPTNEVLNSGNYYAITFNHVDEDIDIYGPDPSLAIGGGSYYDNGYSFYAPDEATAITATGTDEDLQFCIFSTQDVYINTIFIAMDAEPGAASRVLVNTEDEYMTISNVVVQGLSGIQFVNESFAQRPYFLPKGGKFEYNYNDDATDNVSVVNFAFQSFFIPPTVNG